MEIMRKCMMATMMRTMNVDTVTGTATNMIVSIEMSTSTRVVIG
jgi:hypothetical protein